MRSPFVLTLLTTAILISGCSTSSAPEVGLTQPASQYDDRMLDSLGSQRYSEQQMLYMRKVKALEHNLDSLEDKRRALEASMSVSQLEAGAGKLQASDSEAVRMTDFAGATQESQVRVAKESAQHAVNQSLIENDRDRQLMEAELEANRSLVTLDQKYANSIQDAQSESERSRLKSELEVEKAKAEAQRKKALIEADSTRDLSNLEQSFQSRIADARQSAATFSQAASQETQKQRIKVALANADSQRRVKDDIIAVRGSLSALQAEKQSAAQQLHDQISALSEQIASLQGRVAGVEAGYDSKIALQQYKLDALNGQSKELADVEQSLINMPVIGGGQSLGVSSGGDTLRLESDLQRAKGELLVQKSNRLSEVDQQLSRDIDMLVSNLSRSVSAAPSVSNDTNARIDKAANESAIRSGLAAKRTQINNDARSQLAELTVRTEIAKAGVVAPVVTSRAVYSGAYGDNPAAFAARESNEARQLVASAKLEIRPAASSKRAQAEEPLQVRSPEIKVAPLIVASSFEPKPVRAQANQVEDVIIASGTMSGGDLKPLVVAPSGTTYTVVYRYAEKGSADKFSAYLNAYGIDDFTYRYSEKLHQHVLFMGKYSGKDQAAGRVSFLNKTTNTNNAQIVENDL